MTMQPSPNKHDSMAIDVAAVESRMVAVRGENVLLDRDVAALYGVETKHVNQAVRNNPGKFPPGYVFELSGDEVASLRSKILTLDDEGDLRSKILTANVRSKSRVPPKVFTERGLYMLATILKSERALDLFYSTETYRQLSDPKYGLQLMSDGYIVDNVLPELLGCYA